MVRTHRSFDLQNLVPWGLSSFPGQLPSASSPQCPRDPNPRVLQSKLIYVVSTVNFRHFLQLLFYRNLAKGSAREARHMITSVPSPVSGRPAHCPLPKREGNFPGGPALKGVTQSQTEGQGVHLLHTRLHPQVAASASVSHWLLGPPAGRCVAR